MAWRLPVTFVRHEVTMLILGSATAIAGHGAGAATLEWVEGHHEQRLVFWLLLFAALTMAFYGAYENPLPQRLSVRLKVRIAAWGAVPWMLGAVAVICLYGFAAATHRLIAGQPIAILIFAGYAVAFMRKRRGKRMLEGDPSCV